MNFTESWSQLVDLIESSTDPLIATDAGTYRGEPQAGELLRGIAITVQAIGWDDLFYQFCIRVYAPTNQDVLDVQDELVRTVDALDTLLDTQDTFERASGNVEWHEPLNAFVAISVIQCGRDL